MKLPNIFNTLTSGAGRQVLKVRAASPTLLFAAGVVGVVAATVLACRATLKMDEVLLESQDEMAHLEEQAIAEQASEDDVNKLRIVVHLRTGFKIAGLYAPAVVVGGLGIAALTGSHIILNRRNVALTAAYAAVDKAFREYRQRVVDQFGDDKDRELRYDLREREIVEETKNGPVTKIVKDVPGKASMYARFFERGTSDNWKPMPGYNQAFIQTQQNWANNKLQATGHLFLNEVHDMLGMSRTPAGQIVGWVKGHGDDYVDFGIFKNNADSVASFLRGDEPSVLLDFNVDGVIYDLLEQ